MRLVFVHGWGFDPHFWDALRAHLPGYRIDCVDLGFFSGVAPVLDFSDREPAVLVGHSLGFLWGMQQPVQWAGWVAINSFARFVNGDGQAGCVAVAVLRDMQRRLKADIAQTLEGFYQLIGCEAGRLDGHAPRLSLGLDWLRDGDVAAMLADIPGRVLAGRQDALVPVAMSETLGALASQGIGWHAQGGHVLPLTDPGFCAAQIKNFMASLAAGKIAQAFDAAAGCYDAAAKMQAEIAENLIQQARPSYSPATILDIGCGTGLVAAAVRRRWPNAAITGLDRSPAMLRVAQEQVPGLKVIEGDAVQPPPMQYDVIFSSMILHWLSDPAAVLRRWQACLKPGGKLYVALLGTESFKEWQAAHEAQGFADGLWPMPDIADFAEIADEGRLENRVISYGSSAQFLRALKATGAATAHPGYQPAPAGQLRYMLRVLPQPFAVTYQVIYLTLSA